jgi:hypothetical protein
VDILPSSLGTSLPLVFSKGSFDYKDHLGRRGKRQDGVLLGESICSNLTNKNMFSKSPPMGILQPVSVIQS